MRSLKRLANKIGRRGYFLFLFGMLGIVYGVYLTILPTGNTTTRLLAELLPVELFGVIWLIMGVVCWVQMWMRQDRLAFVLASAVLGSWGMLNLGMWAASLIPLGWVSASIFATLAGGALIVAGWPETPIWPTTQAALVTANAEGNILLMNSEAEELFGVGHEVIGQPLTVLMPPVYREMHGAAFSRAATGKFKLQGQTVSVHALRGDGRIIPIRLQVARWEQSGKIGFTATIEPVGGSEP